MFRQPSSRRAEYETYLQSEHWAEFSQSIKRDRKVCESCKIDDYKAYQKYRQSLNVHHKTYANLGHEQPGDVELLCYRCHMDKHGEVGWVDFVQGFSMPEVKEFFPHCANCDRVVNVPLFNQDELERDYLCNDCRGG